MKIKISKAKNSNLDNISEIFRIESSRKPYPQKWNKKSALKKMKDSLKTQDVYIIKLNKEVIGLSTSYVEKDNKEKAYIDEFWITNKYQRKGFGKELMTFLERFYKRKGVKTIQLFAGRKTGAYKFYKKLRYKNSDKNVFMEKKLK